MNGLPMTLARLSIIHDAPVRSLAASWILALALMSGAQSWLTAASTEDGVYISHRSNIPIRLHRPGLDLQTVAAVEFWQTNNNGDTWLLVRKVSVDATMRESGQISFPFQPSRDGRYGFRICVIHDDGQRDPEPRSGQRPAISDRIEIDTTLPEIVRFEVEAVGDESPEATFSITWAVRDLHPGNHPASIQWQDRSGTWQTINDRLGVFGNQRLNLPEATHIRLLAKDLAGNVSISDPQPVNRTQKPSPIVPGEDENEPAQAAPPNPQANAPEANAAPSTQGEAQGEAPANSSAPETSSPNAPTLNLPSREALLKAAGRSPSQQPEAAQVQPAPVVPAGHQDVVEPFLERQATPAQPVAPALHDDSPLEPVDHSPSDPGPNSATGNAASPPTPTVLPPPPDRDEILAQARRLRDEGRLAEAQQRYQSLRGTSLAASALPEEMVVLRRLGRGDEALAAHRVAPAATISDASRCVQALLLVDAQQAQQALTVLALIERGSTHYREARFVEGLAFHNLGQRGEAHARMRILAATDDQWGSAARRWLTDNPL